MAEIPFEPYTGQSKLRFWCQKVLPLVYDDSLSYYELLNKVVDYLNNTITDVSACEDNITALRDAFVQLQDYVNEVLDDFAPEVEHIIDEMIDSGEFGKILADVVNGLIANEYSTTQGYAQFDYVLKDGKLYCATASTSGEWDATKWRETTVGGDMQLLNQRVYNLNAGQVAYDNNATYSSNTVGYKINNLNNAGENTLDDCNNFILGIKKVGPSTLNMPENAYGFIKSYIAQNNSWKWQLLITTQTPQKIFKRANINNTGWTEWVRIADNTDIDNLNAGQIEYNSENTYDNATVGKELQELKGSLNAITPLDSTPTSESTKGITSGAVFDALYNYYKTGNSYTVAGGQIGHVTTGKTRLRLYFQTANKLTDNITGSRISLISLTGAIRHSLGGYIDGKTGGYNWLTNENYTCSVPLVYPSSNTIEVSIVKNSGVFQAGETESSLTDIPNNSIINGALSMRFSITQ